MILKNMVKIVKLKTNGYCLEDLVLMASSMLKAGKVIALPTDTLYGIAALAQNVVAVQNIYKIKQRNIHKPLAICVGDIEDIPRWGKITFPHCLLSELFPGPVTVVMERQPALNHGLNPEVPLIGIRIPNNQFICGVAQVCNEPLALTSANISSATSTLAIEEFKEIWPMLDLIVDGGILGQQDPKRQGSTVVDLSVKSSYKIIRPGCSLENTEKILRKHGLLER